jgi:hypothetical protein
MEHTLSKELKEIEQYVIAMKSNPNVTVTSEDVVDDVLAVLQESEIDEDTQYEIEVLLYALLDNTASPREMIRKARKLIYKKTDTLQYKRYTRGAEFYDEKSDYKDEEQFDGMEFE